MSHETWTRREPQADATLHIPMLPTYAPCELEVSNRRGLISVHSAPQGLGPTRASSQRGPIRMHISHPHESRQGATDTAPDPRSTQPTVRALPHQAAISLALSQLQSTSHIPSLGRTGSASDCTRVQSSILCRFYLECRRPTAIHHGGSRPPPACQMHETRGATTSPPLPKQLESATRRRHLPHTDARQCNLHTIPLLRGAPPPYRDSPRWLALSIRHQHAGYMRPGARRPVPLCLNSWSRPPGGTT